MSHWLWIIRVWNSEVQYKRNVVFLFMFFIDYANWAKESINQQICLSMERKSQSQSTPSLFGTFQNRSSRWFWPPLWSRFSFSGCYGTETQVSYGQGFCLGLGTGLSVFIVFSKVIDIYQRVDDACWKISHESLCWWSDHLDPGNALRKEISCMVIEIGEKLGILMGILFLGFGFSCLSFININDVMI